MSTDENWMDALSIISDGLPSVTEGCRLPVRMQQQVIMSPPHSKFLTDRLRYGQPNYHHAKSSFQILVGSCMTKYHPSLVST